MHEQGRRGRAGRGIFAALLVVLVGAAGWWAGSEATVERATAVDADAQQVLATVQQITVGRTLAYSVTVEQPFDVIASNALAGVVTSVGSGAQVGVGDVLYTVGATDVRAVLGGAPFWRDLTLGAEGTDVRELQQALVELGYQTATPDGKFGASTVRAVRAWQKETGQDATGTVTLGTLVAVPSLPAVVTLDEAIRPGLVVAGAEPAVLTRTHDARFALVLTEEQAAAIPTGTRVDIASGESTWDAVVATIEASDDQNGLVELELTAPDGSSVCGADCATLPAQESTYLTAQVHVSEQADGPGVPVAAVHTDASGATYVVATSGERRAVTVRGSADGMAVVDGLDVGDQVVLLGPGVSDAAAALDPSGTTAVTGAGSAG